MSLAKSNHRMRFEKLESRWLLATDLACEVDMEQPVPTNLELIAELLDPPDSADASAEVQCEVDESSDDSGTSTASDEPTDTSNSGNDGTSDGDVSEADIAQALDEQSIGGEGESASNGESDASTSAVRVAALLGQMLDFVSDQSQSADVSSSVEDASSSSQEFGVLPPDFQRRNDSAVRQETDLTRQRSDAPNLLPTDPPRPAVTFTSQQVREPRETSRVSDVFVGTREIVLRSSTGGQGQQPFSDTSNIPANEGVGISARIAEQVDFNVPYVAGSLDLSWVSDAVGKIDDQALFENSDTDAAILSYLRTIQWPLVPLIAGLAYAVTRSIDQQSETAEPEQMAIRRRRWKRLAFTT
jgi:hypothetical protein